MKSVNTPEAPRLGVARSRNGQTQSRSVQIKAPNFQTAIFEIVGNAPLVIHRRDSAGYDMERNDAVWLS